MASRRGSLDLSIMRRRPPSARIYYCYGEFQPMFNNYPRVNFHEGLAELSHEVFHERESTLMIVDDLMLKSKNSRQTFSREFRITAILPQYFTENVFDKNKYNRTISLNAHYLVFIKDPRDGTEFTTLSRQMYPNSYKFGVEAYVVGASVPYDYLLVDLKSDQDERCRLRTNIFPSEAQYAYVKK